MKTKILASILCLTTMAALSMDKAYTLTGEVKKKEPGKDKIPCKRHKKLRRKKHGKK